MTTDIRDHCFPIGDYIREELKARGWSTAYAAARLPGNLDENTVWLDMLTCVGLWYEHDIAFSQEEADQLERIFGVSAETCMNLHKSFVECKAKFKEGTP